MFQDKQDKKFELELLKMQMEHQKQSHEQRLTEINVNADISESAALYKHASRSSGNWFIEALRGSVRPTITYLFFFAFCTVKLTILFSMIGQPDIEAIEIAFAVWDDETAALFSAIIGFWFGQRAIARNKK